MQILPSQINFFIFIYKEINNENSNDEGRITTESIN